MRLKRGVFTTSASIKSSEADLQSQMQQYNNHNVALTIIWPVCDSCFMLS